jgi:transposase
MDQCINDPGLILGMNQAYGGPKTWTFMQDGASAHTSADTMAYLRTYMNVLEDWPSGSPDLNPIENLWAILKDRVALLHPTTLEELEDAIRTAWNEITPDLIANLIGSMPERPNATVAAQGHPNGYCMAE